MVDIHKEINETLPNPLVSIVIGTFNSERFLQRTLESVYLQTYKNIEIIIVDDGSTDGTRDILEDFKKRGDNIKIYYQENHGLAAMRNKIYEYAKGEWVAIIDSDDLCYPNRIEEQLKISTDYPEADLIFCNTDYIDEYDLKIGDHLSKMKPLPKFIKKGQAARLLLRYGCFIDSEAFFAKKELIKMAGPVDTSFKYSADYEHFIRLGIVGNFAYTDKTLAAWRVHPAQMTKYHANIYKRELIKIYARYYFHDFMNASTRMIVFLKMIKLILRMSLKWRG